jgi:4-hydroxybenzoyl-CoA thioesterase/acyl-CoA thioester hydrolase
MAEPFRTTRRVEFCDTDAAGIIHFTALFEYMEQAEHELLRSRDLSVFMNDDAGIISWPRVAAKCEFQSAARFEDVLDVEVRILRLGEKSVTYAFRLSLEGADVATGEMTSVCCRMTDQAPPQPIAIPAWFREKLAGFVDA